MAGKINVIIGAVGIVATALTTSAVALADPSIYDNGYGNAQDTINGLQAQGYTVVLNGAAVYPLSGCKTLGVEGLRSDNVNPSGSRRDATRFDVVYVDISCKGG